MVSGILLDSPQRGPGITATVARTNGVTVGSEIIWSSDFDPAITSSDAAARATASTTLTLAFAGAIWVAFTLAEHGGQRKLKDTLGTASWQSYALVRVGLQGATKRPARVTQAIYARAVEADAEALSDGDHGKLAARLNLALIKLRRDDFSFGALYESGLEELEALSSIVGDNTTRPNSTSAAPSTRYACRSTSTAESHSSTRITPVARNRTGCSRSARVPTGWRSNWSSA